MTGHRQIPSKIKHHLFTSYFNRANDRAKFDYWGGRKALHLASLWSDDIDVETIEVFQNNHLEVGDQKGII